MENVNWRTKAVYLLIAAVLAIGLIPITSGMVSAGHATIMVTGPSYTKLGQNVTFTAATTPDPADSVDWYIDNVFRETDVAKPFEVTTSFGSAGPHTVSATAHWSNLDQTDIWTIMVGTGLMPQIAWNVVGGEETFTVPLPLYNGKVTQWTVLDAHMGGGASRVIAGGQPGNNSITIQAATYGESLVRADTSVNGDVLYGVKKWGKIDDTILLNWVDSNHNGIQDPGEVTSNPDSVTIVWNEAAKLWWGNGTLIEQVIGTFMRNGEQTPDLEHPADGAVVHWFLFSANAPVDNLPDSEATAIAARGDLQNPGLLDQLEALQLKYAPNHVVFTSNGGISATTVSGDVDLNNDGIIEDNEMGLTGNGLSANGEEAVKVVAVATYPNIDQAAEWPVFAEVTSWNFWTQQVEKVPQVRWAGEEIILEKYFGTIGYPVKFVLENQSNGALTNVNADDPQTPEVILASGAQEVSTVVGADGVARCDLISESPGEVDVDAFLYDGNGTLINKHGFVVFFLKLESVTLTNVLGNRVDNPLTAAIEGHDSGLWAPENAWNATLDDTTGTMNVSADTLLRARVKGWFMGDNLSARPEKVIDIDPYYDSDGDGITNNDADVTLPKGRWVLPDDWRTLAGPNWQILRPHWDIMDQPNDNIMSATDGNIHWDAVLDQWVITTPVDWAEEFGPYFPWVENPGSGVSMIVGPAVAMPPVIGPYNSLDSYTAAVNPLVGCKTIVPNGELNWWDCPMPPAKVLFEITGATDIGYFKEVNKDNVYYHLEYTSLQDVSELYTNPFYAEMIPASPLIPPFVNNGGYDWNSWDTSYGPYGFWEFINQPDQGIPGPDPQHPTMVEVYSDNHGEAMVWLNGDWNLNTLAKGTTYDQIWKDWTEMASEDPANPPVAGTSTVVATADYPYLRKHEAMMSNEVEKFWTWGKVKLIDVTQMPPVENGLTNGEKLVLVWLTDRDGMPAVGEQIVWEVPTDNAKIIGFLSDTSGVYTDLQNKEGMSVTRLATPEEAAKFAALHPEYPADLPCPAVAGVVLLGVNGVLPNATIVMEMYEREGVLIANPSIDYYHESEQDPALTAGLNTGVYMGSSQSVVDATSTIASSLEAIWWQDGSGNWHAYQPGAPAWANDLSMLEPGNIYWVKVTQDCLWNWVLHG